MAGGKGDARRVASVTWRTMLNRFHPEGIPWPATAVYNADGRLPVYIDGEAPDSLLYMRKVEITP